MDYTETPLKIFAGGFGLKYRKQLIRVIEDQMAISFNDKIAYMTLQFSKEYITAVFEKGVDGPKNMPEICAGEFINLFNYHLRHQILSLWNKTYEVCYEEDKAFSHGVDKETWNAFYGKFRETLEASLMVYEKALQRA